MSASFISTRMTIYDIPTAKEKFEQLASALDAAADFIGSIKPNDPPLTDDQLLPFMDSYSASDPNGDPIRTGFDSVVYLATSANDAEAAGDFRRRYAELLELWDSDARQDGKYRDALSAHAGYLWGFLEEIVKAESRGDEPDNGTDQSTAKRKRTRHIPYKQALAILERLNVPKDRKTLQRWMKGKNTPADFTPECMLTIDHFAAWAKIYANREQAKINTNNALCIDNPKSRRMGKFR